MIPEEVFHYTKSSNAEKILGGKHIRLSQFKETNDLRESKRWTGFPIERLGAAPVNDKDLLRSDESNRQLNNKINDIKLREWKVLCTSTNHPQQRKRDNPFYLGNCRPNMWAHYGENHKGICLKLNGKMLDHRIKELKNKKGYSVFSGKVKYNDFDLFKPIFFRKNFDQMSQDLNQEVRDHLKYYYREYFLLKARDWITEHEFRWMVFSQDYAPEYISIEGIIEGITIGEKYPQEDIPLIKKLCSELGIKLTGMNWKIDIPFPDAIV